MKRLLIIQDISPDKVMKAYEKIKEGWTEVQFISYPPLAWTPMQVTFTCIGKPPLSNRFECIV